MRATLLLATVVVLLSAACDGDDSMPSRTSTPAGTATATPEAGAIDARPGNTEPITIAAQVAGGIATQTAIRLGLHPEAGGWDRVVFEFDRGIPETQASYVDSVSSCGSGEPMPVNGAAILSVRMVSAQAHNDAGMATVPREIPGQGGVVREAKAYCDFEGHVDWAIGLRERKPFKITTLSNPPRIVIDIKQ